MSDVVAIRDRVRFTGPTVGSTLVERTRLDACFDAAVGKVVRVLAPAGYGKSTLVARWLRRDTRRVCWLDLEPIDDDPLVLAHALISGLVGPRSVCDDEDPDGAVDELQRLIDELERLIDGLDEPFVLVLDDIHHLVGESSTRLINVLIDGLAPDSTIILVGRAHHRAEGIARRRLHPGVIDVDSAALAFDLVETEELLILLGIEPDIDMVTDLAEQFEGWPAGIRLASQTMAPVRAGGAPALTSLGDLTAVTDYVTEEWFGGLVAEDQTFLTEVGCLGRFNAEQCDAVLGCRGSASTLRRLCRNELLVIALDQHDHWYRMHGILAHWLSERLRSNDPARWREIHLAAARWWALQGDIDLAIEHVAAANDEDLLEELVSLNAATYAARGMFHTIERWMAHFSASRVSGSPLLRHAMALSAIVAGDGERALGWTRLCLVDHEPIDRAVDGVADLVAYQTDALLVTFETEPASALLPAGWRAHRHLPHGEWRGLASMALGANLFLCGDERAEDVLREALFEFEVSESTTMQGSASAVLAAVLAISGSADEASELSARALRIHTTRLGEDAPPTPVAHAGAAFEAARAGRHDDAVAHIRVARQHLIGFDRCAPWFNILALFLLVRACLRVDEVAAAKELMQRLDDKMQHQDATTPLARSIDELRDAVCAASELSLTRLWSLTAAELRVAQFLPTNLSLADIATQLFVSRNTVKSHAASIYRKLGTSSRAEAVDLLRRAGLLTETWDGDRRPGGLPR